MGDLFSFVSSKEVFFHHGDQITVFSPLCGRKNTNKTWLKRKVLNSTLETKTSSPLTKKVAGSAFSEIPEKKNGYFTDFNVGIEHLCCKD